MVDSFPWFPHLDYAGEPMLEGHFRDPPIEMLFTAIAHGDEEHRKWLWNALHAFFEGKPIPNQQ